MNVQNFFNSISNSLEEVGNSNCFISNFIDELKSSLTKSNSIKDSKTLTTNDTNNLFTLDRYEGNYAICENRDTGEILNIPINKISPNAKEGDILKFKNNIYQIDYEATKDVSDHIRDFFDSLSNSK